MGKFKNILLCSDLDGTLTYDGVIPENNISAIKHFIDEGGKFCVSTGRMPSYLSENHFDKSLLSNCPVICCNGACIYDFASDKILYEKPITTIPDNFFNSLKKYADIIQICDIYVSGLKSVRTTQFASDFPTIEATINSGTAYKVVLAFEDEQSANIVRDDFAKKFGNVYNISKSWPVGVEVMDKDATKGHTIKVLNDILGDNRITVGAGDYENDITMLTMADIGCAVENATPSLKAAADKVVCHSSDGAIDYIIKNVLDWI